MAKVKADILGDVEKGLDEAGRSTQVPEDTWDYQKTAAKEPPYTLEALAHLLEINTYHFRCCKTKAIVTAGLGYDFVVPEGIDSPNEEMTWGEILENVITDFEALGNGYFEVVRNRFGRGQPLDGCVHLVVHAVQARERRATHKSLRPST